MRGAKATIVLLGGHAPSPGMALFWTVLSLRLPAAAIGTIALMRRASTPQVDAPEHGAAHQPRPACNA